MSNARHVFISYRRDGATNQGWAERVDRRLTAGGFTVWRDVEGVGPGQRWSRIIPPALDAAALVLCVVSESLLESEWVDNELNYALRRQLLVIPLQVEPEYRPPFHLSGVQELDLHRDAPEAWDKLLALVERHAPGGLRPRPADERIASPSPQRRRELQYLDGLLYTQKAVAQLTPIYTELAGVEHRTPSLAKALPADLMPVSFLHQRAGGSRREGSTEGARFSDILKVFSGYESSTHAPRLAVLGEPGAGKSFALRRLTGRYALRAVEDADAPVPLLVELGRWTAELQSFDAFLHAEIGVLASDLQALIRSGRAWLLLDALNEIPTAQQSYKVRQIQPWLNDRRLAGLVVSCRERDFVGDLRLDMDTLAIEPLDPPRIHSFIRRYLEIIEPVDAEARAETFFWQLAIGDDPQVAEAVRQAWQQAREGGAEDFGQFWYLNLSVQFVLPHFLESGIAAIEADPRALLRLAQNPYLLNILLGLYLQGRLPPHGQQRAMVFSVFVDDLLLRERERYRKATGREESPGEKDLFGALGELAWSLQHAGLDSERRSVQTIVMMPVALRALTSPQLEHAAAANLIEFKGHGVSFTHQLLQEYFAALGLKAEIDSGRLAARDLWPAGRWWARMGWEEVINTLAGFYLDDPDPLVDWLGEANPEVLADGLVANGVAASSSRRLRQRSRDWIARMTDPEREPDPAARAALGRALGRLNLDDRPGVGLDERGLPDIDWVDIRRGPILGFWIRVFGGGRALAIARYPITNAQYQAFVDDGGYQNPKWWADLTKGTVGPSTWPEPNAPRTDIGWAEAVAFTRWLSDKTGERIRLPTTAEWCDAVGGGKRRTYPWGDEYRSGRANLEETGGAVSVGRTSAVGIFPGGATAQGVQDMYGNVWEWCLTGSDDPGDAFEPRVDYDEELDEDGLGPDSPGLDLLLGASWMESDAVPVDATAAQWGFARARAGTVGFRVVREPGDGRRPA